MCVCKELQGIEIALDVSPLSQVYERHVREAISPQCCLKHLRCNPSKIQQNNCLCAAGK